MPKQLISLRAVFICDQCREGMMEFTNIVQTVNPPRYEHQCTGCEYKDYYSTTYPDVEYTYA